MFLYGRCFAYSPQYSHFSKKRVNNADHRIIKSQPGCYRREYFFKAGFIEIKHCFQQVINVSRTDIVLYFINILVFYQAVQLIFS